MLYSFSPGNTSDMIFSIIALGAALFVQAPDQTSGLAQASTQSPSPGQAQLPAQAQAQAQAQVAQVVRVAAFAPSRPVTTDTAIEGSEEAAGDVEPVFEPVRTRQVCRYIEVTGQRFPVRSCRTVVIEQDER